MKGFCKVNTPFPILSNHNIILTITYNQNIHKLQIKNKILIISRAYCNNKNYAAFDFWKNTFIDWVLVLDAADKGCAGT